MFLGGPDSNELRVQESSRLFLTRVCASSVRMSAPETRRTLSQCRSDGYTRADVQRGGAERALRGVLRPLLSAVPLRLVRPPAFPAVVLILRLFCIPSGDQFFVSVLKSGPASCPNPCTRLGLRGLPVCPLCSPQVSSALPLNGQ